MAGGGCVVAGVLMVVATGVWAVHWLVYPFFGTGVLGGFTTFSACVVDVWHLLRGGYVCTGLACLVLNVAVVLAAVWCGAAVTCGLAVWRRG
ncbi:fluoride efflux transporter FluC [Streptomyces iranensis]|uniref:fluoride efflux transporter FluC n=1 Tax=Streptomyces iranensis TaxID=576784 RepID=UPI0036D433D4